MSWICIRNQNKKIKKYWIQTQTSCQLTLTFSCGLRDLPQNFFFHFRMVADFLPLSPDAPLLGQLRQLFLVRNHKADHVVLLTAGTNGRNRVKVKVAVSFSYNSHPTAQTLKDQATENYKHICWGGGKKQKKLPFIFQTLLCYKKCFTQYFHHTQCLKI